MQPAAPCIANMHTDSPAPVAAAPAKPALRMEDVQSAILSWDLVLDVLQPLGGSSLATAGPHHQSGGSGGSAGSKGRGGKGQSGGVRRMERFPDMGSYVAHFKRLLLEELRAAVSGYCCVFSVSMYIALL